MTRYRAEPGWDEKLRAQPAMRDGMSDRAKIVAKHVRVAAPVGPPQDDPRHRHYKALVHPAGARVVAYSYRWHWVEFGSVHNHPSAPLRRGTLAAGLTFVPHPRPA